MLNIPDAILLCGGAGLRLRDVTGSGPKSMATIGGRPFLELLLKQLRRRGFERAILAVGYQRDVIRSFYGEVAFGLHLAYSAESSPLGTGGALRNAADLVQSDTVLVMNGDSYTDADLIRFVSEHRQSGADASLIVAQTDGRTDCGSVQFDQSGKLELFEEKEASFGTRYFNAGIYLVSRQILYDIPRGVQVSLEREVFPRWLKEGYYIRAFTHSGKCVDIGTPDRYHCAQDVLANVEAQEGLAQSETHL